MNRLIPTKRLVQRNISTASRVLNPMDSDTTDLGLQLRLTLQKRWKLGAGCTALVARNTTSQQATLSAVYRF